MVIAKYVTPTVFKFHVKNAKLSDNKLHFLERITLVWGVEGKDTNEQERVLGH